MPDPVNKACFEGKHCTMQIEPHARGVVVMRISGTDVGEFGETPMLVLNDYLTGREPVRLFIDAREVRGASIEVSAEWAVWLGKHKVQVREISMLTGSRFIEVTADFVRRFAELEGVMRIYTEPDAFDAALAESLASGA
jgi:hypothetical protein